PQAPTPEPVARPRKKAVSNKTVGQAKRVTFSREMTDQVMLWFNDCRERGLFDSSKKKDYGPVWQEVMERCREAWPQFPWSTKVIAVKYETEKKRFQLWKMLVDGYSGVTFDHETGLPQVSDATWKQFVKRNNTTSRRVIWLRTVPLGDVDIYRSVFFRERASGTYIAEAGDAESNDMGGAGDAGDDSGRDNPDLLDDESDDDDVTVITPVPQKRLTAAQKRRLENDPDHTPTDRESSASINIPPSSAKKRVRERDSQILANSIRDAVTILATAPQVNVQGLAGGDDVGKAIDDIQRLFAKEVSDEELLNCIDRLQSNPMLALTWNRLSLPLKKLYIRRWVGGSEA
ncbi:hypothetical protein C8A03DRAFT_19989, partial [Achaetomium macrosporum]